MTSLFKRTENTITDKNVAKQKEMIEYLEDHISKITDIISGV